MTIYSPEILSDIGKVVDYYPMSPFKQSPLRLIEPYCLLLHYKTELAELLEARRKEDKNIQLQLPDTFQQKDYHLGPLLDYVSSKYDSQIAQEKARWQKEVPMCTFAWLWLLFRPGSVAVSWSNGIPCAFKISSHDKAERDTKRIVTAPTLVGNGPSKFFKPPEALSLRMWSIEYDGRILGRLQKIVIIAPFEGEKPISALPLVPLSHWQDFQGISRSALQDRLVNRGKEYFRLTKRTYCEYHGKAVSWPNRVVSSPLTIRSSVFSHNTTDKWPNHD